MSIGQMTCCSQILSYLISE